MVGINIEASPQQLEKILRAPICIITLYDTEVRRIYL